MTTTELLGLGLERHRAGRLLEAQQIYRQVLAVEPQLAEAWHLLGMVAYQCGNAELAVNCGQAALRLKPDFAEAHNNLSVVWRDCGQFEPAMLHAHRALQLKPGLAEAHNNLGVIQQLLGQLDESQACYRRAIELNPAYAEAHNNLAAALQYGGNFDEALACCSRALGLQPRYAEAHFNQAVLLLLQGDFERGLPEYEWRHRCLDARGQAAIASPWDGSRLAGAILLHGEQGFGDTFQFIRYAHLVKQRVGKVMLRCSRTLFPLLRSCVAIGEFHPLEAPPPAAEAEIQLLSLPFVCGTTLATIPSRVPYLFADERLVADWRERLPEGFRVGIAWQGNPRFKRDHERSIPLEQFAGLAEVHGVRLIRLQVDGDSAQDSTSATFPLVDLGPDFDRRGGAFMDTAAVMKNLDLVITSDTAVAHLAGALGVPVWVALPFVPDWRWMLDRSDSPWYPTMRLFRQRTPGDWNAVFGEIRLALGEQVERQD